ncbi:MAG: TraR/DksA family transcriptional regulator [Thermodesulfobacteriota bacterium]
MSDRMDKSGIDLKHFRLLLVKIRDDLMEAELSGSNETDTVELDQTKIGRLTRMDALQSQQMALEAQRRRKIQIRRIDAAWQRLENGEFGICSYCEGVIEMERLEFDPTTVFCSECVNNQEL